MDHFAGRFEDELKAGRRCVHMQAYDVGGGQIRWDGVWESGGSHGQSRAIGWALDDFAARFDEEVADGKRCVHMQAYDAGGGQIRYDGVWERAEGAQQTRAISWAIDHFAGRFDDELKAGRRCVHMQAYDVGGGQIRYDGVWERGGNRGQSRAIGWAFNHFIRRWDEELAKGQRLVKMQAYDLGGGNLRFDGIWETASGPQKRVLGLPLSPFADHFDELTSSGWHVEHMSSRLRMYPGLPQLTAGAIRLTAANRMVSFGSDVDENPAVMAPLPIPPLSERDPGCDFGPGPSVRRPQRIR